MAAMRPSVMRCLASSRTPIRSLATESLAAPVAPEDSAFFTGNPKYYNALITINALLRKHNLPLTKRRIPTGPEIPKWMGMEDMSKRFDMKLSLGTYRGLIHKLSILASHPDKDAETMEALKSFVKPTAVQYAVKQATPELDAYGRAYAQGSRKTARAQVWMVKGEGKVVVNGKPLEEYFILKEQQKNAVHALESVSALGQYNVWALVEGGGFNGQSDALKVAIARALVIHNNALLDSFKAQKLTVIDTRQVERKKTGQPKARAKNTW